MTELHRTEWHRLLWAKSAKKDRETGTLGVWTPVLAHLLDVAACAWEEDHLVQPEMEVDTFELG